MVLKSDRELGDPSLKFGPVIIRPGTDTFLEARLSSENKETWLDLEMTGLVELRDRTKLPMNLTPTQRSSRSIVAGVTGASSALALVSIGDIKSISLSASKGRYRIVREVATYNGLVAKDKGCYRDMMHALNLEGIAQRRAIHEIVDLGCAEDVELPRIVLSQKPVAGVPGATEVRLARPRNNEDEIGVDISGIVPSRLIENGKMPVEEELHGSENAKFEVQ